MGEVLEYSKPSQRFVNCENLHNRIILRQRNIDLFHERPLLHILTQEDHSFAHFAKSRITTFILNFLHDMFFVFLGCYLDLGRGDQQDFLDLS